MIDRNHDLSITRQAQLVGISRSSVYNTPRPGSAADLALMRRIDALHMNYPFAGSRMLRDLLNRQRDVDGVLADPVARQARGSAHAPDGHHGTLPKARHQHASSRAHRVCRGPGEATGGGQSQRHHQRPAAGAV